MVGKKKKTFSIFKRTDYARFTELVASLGIRAK